MTEQQQSGELEERDQHQPIECSECGKLGRPPGGILFKRNGSRITQSFALPEGWAFMECALFCRGCAVSTFLASYKRIRTDSVASLVLARTSGSASSLGGIGVSTEDQEEYNARRNKRLKQRKNATQR